ncbi:MAG: peptide deformylase [bacterium]
MIRKILKYPNPILKKKSGEVKEINEEIKKLSQDMLEALRQAQGVGLAAPQISELKRIIIVKDRAFINPEIVKKTKEKALAEEGCLCFPGIYLKVKRAKGVEIKALDLEGREIKIKAVGLLARVFQHEIDHLNGVLIIDRLTFWQRWKIRKKLKG